MTSLSFLHWYCFLLFSRSLAIQSFVLSWVFLRFPDTINSFLFSVQCGNLVLHGNISIRDTKNFSLRSKIYRKEQNNEMYLLLTWYVTWNVIFSYVGIIHWWSTNETKRDMMRFFPLLSLWLIAPASAILWPHSDLRTWLHSSWQFSMKACENNDK